MSTTAPAAVNFSEKGRLHALCFATARANGTPVTTFAGFRWRSKPTVEAVHLFLHKKSPEDFDLLRYGLATNGVSM